MNIKEFKQWWNRFEYSGNFPEPKAEHINLLLAEVDRLRADRQLEADIDLPPGVITLMRENEGLKTALAEKDAEIERGKTYKKAHSEECKMMFAEIGAKLQAAESLAAARLADQEAIERHVTKRVAGEIVDIMNHCETFQDVKAVIWQKYGVE